MKKLSYQSITRKSLIKASLKIFLLLTSLTCSFVLCESVVRYRNKAWPFEQKIKTFPHLSSKDDNLRWRFPPEVGRNSLGLINREITKKEAQHFRILFLGDSLVWSGETSSGELYTQVIERNLNNEPSLAAKQIEIINAGIPGYTTYQELEFLKIYGLDMEPDLVVLGFVFNDVYYKYLHKPVEGSYLGPDPTVQLHRFDTSTFPGILFARSYLAHKSFYALERFVKKSRGYPDFAFERRDDFYLAWKDYGWNETTELIGEMKELLRKKNIQLMVMAFPIADQLDDNYLRINKEYVLYPQQRIKRICDDNRIPFLDLTQALYQNGGTNLSTDGIHLNGKGNDIVAGEAINYLVNSAPIWFNK
jgi:lysophospholipase L1-like esterase